MSAGKIHLVHGYSVASSTQGGQDSDECNSHTHHRLNKSGLFEEVAFCFSIENCLAPGFDFSWSFLQPEIMEGIAGCFPPI